MLELQAACPFRGDLSFIADWREDVLTRRALIRSRLATFRLPGQLRPHEYPDARAYLRAKLPAVADRLDHLQSMRATD